MDIRNKIGQRIKAIRGKKDISQSDLAFYAGIDRSYLAGVENGQRNISVVNLEKIITALEYTLKDFFADESFNEIEELK